MTSPCIVFYVYIHAFPYFPFSISFSLKHVQLDLLSCYFISSLYFKLISIVLLQVFNPGLFLCLCICFISNGIFS